MENVILESIIKLDRRRKPFIHGTTAGYNRHRRLKEAACAECKAAFNDYAKAYKAAHPEKIKEYARTSYDRIKSDPDKWAARMEYLKKFRKDYDYQANREYQMWYYYNVRKPRKLENGATE